MTSASVHSSTLEFISSIAVDISPAAFQQFSTMLLERKNFALDAYKDKCVRRRISIRIRATRCRTADEYVELLQRDETELDRLLQVLTIHVSQFFRNANMFEKLRQEILPALFQRCQAERDGPLRILSIGCASGEEPYSVAIILRESFATDLASCGATITGIDIDANTLADARAAVYAEDRLKELSPLARDRFFAPLGIKYQLAPEVRELVDFHRADMAGEPLPAADLILCRNVLIYLERTQQERLLEKFARALTDDGVLVLGKSETIVGESRRRYRAICPVERIYRVLPVRMA